MNELNLIEQIKKFLDALKAKDEDLAIAEFFNCFIVAEREKKKLTEENG